MFRRFGFALGLSAFVALHAPYVGAQTSAAPSDEDAIIGHGVELRQHGQDEAALAEFRRAYEVSHGARALAQVALAEQALGRWALAEHDLALALGDASNAWIARNHAVLEAALRTIRSHLASLIVSTNAPAGELWVNGQRAASLPMTEPVAVEAGTVGVEVRAPGFATARRTIELSSGSTNRETFYNEPREVEASGGPQHSDRTQPRAAGWLRTVGIGVAVAGAAALVGGVAFHVYWQTRVALYNSDDCFYGGVQRSVRCGGVLDNANAAEATAITLYAVGGAAVVVGGVVALLAPRGRSSEVAASVACAVGPNGFVCRGAF